MNLDDVLVELYAALRGEDFSRSPLEIVHKYMPRGSFRNYRELHNFCRKLEHLSDEATYTYLRENSSISYLHALVIVKGSRGHRETMREIRQGWIEEYGEDPLDYGSELKSASAVANTKFKDDYGVDLYDFRWNMMEVHEVREAMKIELWPFRKSMEETRKVAEEMKKRNKLKK